MKAKHFSHVTRSLFLLAMLSSRRITVVGTGRLGHEDLCHFTHALGSTLTKQESRPHSDILWPVDELKHHNRFLVSLNATLMKTQQNAKIT